VTWIADELYDAGRPGAQTARFDGHGTLGPGPMEALLSALAICASLDIVEILRKRRTPAESLSVDVVGERAERTPARLVRAKLTYDIIGPDLDRGSVEGAVDLSLSKYCSVRQSLDPATTIEFAVTLNGEPGQFRISENVVE
jgi:putative redox protein